MCPVNGDGTAKELHLLTEYYETDNAGGFIANKMFYFPTALSLGDHPELIGKTITIEIK